MDWNKFLDETRENFAKFSASSPETFKGFGIMGKEAKKNGALNESFSFYFGPADYKILNAYDKNLDEVIPLGWGIFGVINRFVFIPLFGFLSSILPYGFEFSKRYFATPIQHVWH